MDKLTVLLGFVAALSLATERITETIKGLPFLSRWLAVEGKNGTTREEFRKASIHLLAIAIGTSLAVSMAPAITSRRPATDVTPSPEAA